MNVHPHPLPSSEFIAGEERQSSLETQSDLVRKSSLRITSNKRGNFVCLTCYTPPDWPFEALQKRTLRPCNGNQRRANLCCV